MSGPPQRGAGVEKAQAALSGSSVDAQAQHYSAIANDPSKGGPEREAAMLFSIAEMNLEEENADIAEGEKAAQQALTLFRTTSNKEGLSDTLRLLVHFARKKADMMRDEAATENKEEIKQVLKEAESMAKTEGKNFEEQNYARGQAAMLLSLAEVNRDRRGSKKRLEALEAALQARDLAKKMLDEKLEAHAICTLVFIKQKMGERREAVALADECLYHFKKVGDKKKEAEALHLLGLTRVQAEEFEEGIAASQEAALLYKQLGRPRQQGFVCYVISQYYLHRNLPQHALPHAQEALNLFRDIAGIKSWVAQAYMAIVDCLSQMGNPKEALRHAEECAELYSQGGDKRGESLALAALSRAHLAAENYQESLRVAEDALNVAQSMKDVRWEAHMMREVAQIHLHMKNYREAERISMESAALMQTLQDRTDEGIMLNTMAESALEQCDYTKALQTVNEQKALFQQSGDRSREATCILSAAGCTVYHGNYEEGVEMAKEALEIFEEIGDLRGSARAHKALLNVHKNHGDFESSLASAENMLETLKLTGDKGAQAEAVREMALIQLARDNPSMAVRHANECQSLCKKAGDKKGECLAWILVSHALCENFSQTGQMEKCRNKALKPAQEGLSMAKKLNSKGHIAHALHQVATVHMLTGRIGDALQNANEARTIFYNSEDRSNEASMVLLMAEIHRAAGKDDKAIEKAEEAKMIAESCGDIEKVRNAEDIIEKIRPPQPPPGQWVCQQEGMVAAPMPAGGDMAEAASSVVAAPEQKGMDPAIVKETVMQVAAAVVGGEDIGMDEALMDSGMDSLSALSFRQNLQQQFGMKLPSSFVFDYPTVREVSDRILDISNEG